MAISFFAVKLGVAQMPDKSNWLSLYGVGILTGNGITMSLIVGNLAFLENTQYIGCVKIGVLDPLGAQLDKGKDLYFDLLKNMAASFKGC